MTKFFSSLLVLACSLAVHTTTAFTFHSPSVNVALKNSRSTTSFTKPVALMRVPSSDRSSVFVAKSTTSTSLSADESSDNESESKSNLPFFLDVGTKGGAVFIAAVAFIIPIIGYNVAVQGFGADGTVVGNYIGVGFTVVACLGWAGTYVFRVANKDMTYVRTPYRLV